MTGSIGQMPGWQGPLSLGWKCSQHRMAQSQHWDPPVPSKGYTGLSPVESPCWCPSKCLTLRCGGTQARVQILVLLFPGWGMVDKSLHSCELQLPPLYTGIVMPSSELNRIL